MSRTITFNRAFAGMSPRIKEARNVLGITQAVLAQRLNTSKGMVQNWEIGIRCPSAHYIRLLSIELGVSADYLLDCER